MTDDGGVWVKIDGENVQGKILQVVRATDGTNRATSSTSFADASISVSITPTATTSSVLLAWAFTATGAADTVFRVQITDASNNPISGAESSSFRASTGGILDLSTTQLAYATPATTSSVTYKGRFLTDAGVVTLLNTTQTGQLFAIEVAA